MDDWQPIDEVQLCTIFRSLPPARQPHRPDLVRAGGLLLRRRAPAMAQAQAQAQGLSRGVDASRPQAQLTVVVLFSSIASSPSTTESPTMAITSSWGICHICVTWKKGLDERTKEGPAAATTRWLAGWLARWMDAWPNK